MKLSALAGTALTVAALAWSVPAPGNIATATASQQASRSARICRPIHHTAGLKNTSDSTTICTRFNR